MLLPAHCPPFLIGTECSSSSFCSILQKVRIDFPSAKSTSNEIVKQMLQIMREKINVKISLHSVFFKIPEHVFNFQQHYIENVVLTFPSPRKPVASRNLEIAKITKILCIRLTGIRTLFFPCQK